MCDPNSFFAGHGIDKIPNIGKKELLLSKSWNKKWGPLYLIVFALKLQKVRTTSIPCDFWVRMGDCQNGMYVEVGKKALKNTILWNYIEIKQLGIENDVIKMKFEYHSKWFSTIHCRRPRWESWTQQHPFRLRFAHFQHFETPSWPEKLLSKILLTFLFDRRRFNNVSAEAFFLRQPSCYARWEMRSAKLENHLKFIPQQKCEIN